MTEDQEKLIIEKLDDAWFRITSGLLYKIIIKGDHSSDGLVIDFIPNKTQLTLLSSLWFRNTILKARQLGCTTLFSILWLDTALFSKEPIRCGVIAQNREVAEVIFRDKVKFAYDNLPEFIKNKVPLSKNSASELIFGHNHSSIRVATSMRAGTLHRLHISEFGKICADYPDKATEVITGSIPAVPKTGIVVIESTAEGQEGDYYKITNRAMAIKEKSKDLNEKDYRFHFFPWTDADEYELDPDNVVITPIYNKYFEEVESVIGFPISTEKRAWYVATCESDFSGDIWKMRQEYPTTPKEAFQVSTEGCYYSDQLSKARSQGRIVKSIPILPIPVNTFWDIGKGDMTAIWLHQEALMQHRFIHYYEYSGEDLIHYVQKLQEISADRKFVYGVHFLPHEAAHKRIGATPDTSKSIKEMLEELWPGQKFVVIPAVSFIMAGIQATRASFSSACFDEKYCDEGIKRLENYKKKWNKTMACWSDEPVHNENSHGADAFRQWGQKLMADGMVILPAKQKHRRRSYYEVVDQGVGY